MSRKFILLAVIILFSLTVSAFAVEIGTRNSPIPIGQAVNISSDWQIKVLSVTPNANEVVKSENTYNDPPKDGDQYLIARIEAKNIGPEINQFNDRYLNVVGASNVSYETVFENVPDPIPSTDVFPSGVFTGNIVWEVHQSDISSLVMYSRYAKPYIFLSIRPSSLTIPAAVSLKNDITTIQLGLGTSPTNKSISNTSILSSSVPKLSGSDTTNYSNPCDKTVYVKGYTKKDGTYVAPYYRRPPGC